MYNTDIYIKTKCILPRRKLFYKASEIYVTKNNINFIIDHDYNTRQLTNPNIPLVQRKLTQPTFYT